MALLKILYIPDPRLRELAKPVTAAEIADPKFQQFIDDMIETMYDARGVGLAATQVGVAKCLVVMDISQTHDQPQVLINPEILEKKDPIRFDEGCLSVPGHYDNLERCYWAKGRAQDRKGNVYELEGEGLIAECLQHEIDHLNGKLYIDYLSKLKQDRIRTKVDKYVRREYTDD